MANVTGPGAVQQDDVDVRPLLEGATEQEYITILNPLPDDFAALVAQDIAVNMPLQIRNKTGLVKEEGDVVRSYGLDLRNPDFQARKHISNSITIKAGETLRIRGDHAQVVVRQLVNELAQREGKTRLLSDPHVRKELEEKVIKGRGLVQDLMDSQLKTTQTQINEAISQSNEVNNETEFPELNQADQSRGTEVSDSPSNGESQSKRVGRPKKTDS